MALEIITVGCIPNPFDNYRIRKAKSEHLLALKLILLHGFRISEVIALTGNDVMIEAEIPYLRLRRPKSQEEEWLPIHPYFMPILKERLNYGRLFSITSKTCNKLLHRGQKKLGLEKYDISCHRLRDVYAINRLKKQNKQLVSRTLRHDSFNTTDKHYSDYDLSDLAPVVADSNVLQSPITPSEFVEKAKKALKTFGLIRPDEYELRIAEDKGSVKIEAIFLKQEK